MRLAPGGRARAPCRARAPSLFCPPRADAAQGNSPCFFSRLFCDRSVAIDVKLAGGGSGTNRDRAEGRGAPAPRCVTRLSPRAGAFVCKMVPFVQSAAVVTEVLTMTCIAVERHRGLVRPFRRRWQSTPRRACAVLGKAPGPRVLCRARLRAGLGRGGIRGVRSAPRLPPPSARLSFGPSPALENSLSSQTHLLGLSFQLYLQISALLRQPSVALP